MARLGRGQSFTRTQVSGGRSAVGAPTMLQPVIPAAAGSQISLSVTMQFENLGTVTGLPPSYDEMLGAARNNTDKAGQQLYEELLGGIQDGPKLYLEDLGSIRDALRLRDESTSSLRSSIAINLEELSSLKLSTGADSENLGSIRVSGMIGIEELASLFDRAALTIEQLASIRQNPPLYYEDLSSAKIVSLSASCPLEALGSSARVGADPLEALGRFATQLGAAMEDLGTLRVTSASHTEGQSSLKDVGSSAFEVLAALQCSYVLGYESLLPASPIILVIDPCFVVTINYAGYAANVKFNYSAVVSPPSYGATVKPDYGATVAPMYTINLKKCC